MFKVDISTKITIAVIAIFINSKPVESVDLKARGKDFFPHVFSD